MDLKKCDKPGCDPVLQTRGQMKKDDYFDVLLNDQMHAFVDRLPPDCTVDDIAELHDDNKTDVRIICRKCHRTTGWGKADAPGMPGVGRDFMARKWGELIGAISNFGNA